MSDELPRCLVSPATRTDTEWRAFYEAEAVRLARENEALKARLLKAESPSTADLGFTMTTYVG